MVAQPPEGRQSLENWAAAPLSKGCALGGGYSGLPGILADRPTTRSENHLEEGC